MSALSWLIAFGSMFATDVCWALYVSKVKDGDALRGAAWAVALFALGAVAVIGYTSQPWLLVPSAAGAFAGTYAGVVYNAKVARSVART